MLISIILLAIASLQAVLAHTVFTTLFIDDVNQGDATCVRMPTVGATCTAPIIDLTSNDMACGVDGVTGVARVCSAVQGSKLTFLWREWADASQPGAIDISHKGPCAVYMKAVDSAIKDPGHGDGWFKIWDYSHDETTNEWCTEKLIKAKGLISVNIPEDLAGGYYLVRPELLSLHEADKTPAQPQFYVGCAQIFLESSATGKPSNTVSIPGYVKAGDPAMTFNIYKPDPFPYPMYGPEVYKSSTSNSRHRIKSRISHTTQNEGLLPANCVVENGNWCGIELESYSTDAACWAQSKICWKQSDVCYGTAPPTGYKGCTAWENKCHANDDACNAGNDIGPLNKGKILTPKITAVYDLNSAFGEEGAQNAVPAGPDGSAPSASSSVADAPVETSARPPYEEPAASTSTTSSATTPVVIDYKPNSHTPTPTLANPESVASVASSVTAAAISSSSPGSIDDESTVIITTFHTVTVTKDCAEAQNSRRAEVPGDGDFSLVLDGFTPSVLVPSGVSASLVPPSSSTSLPAASPPAFKFINSNSSSGAPGDFFKLLPTTDGSCGGTTGFSCLGREQDGGCCSKYGWCGYTDEYCGEGCQEGFGKCGNAGVGAIPPRRAVVKRQEASTVANLSTILRTKTSKGAAQTVSASSTVATRMGTVGRAARYGVWGLRGGGVGCQGEEGMEEGGTFEETC